MMTRSKGVIWTLGGAVLLCACDRTTKPNPLVSADETPRIEARLFDGQTYRTKDGRSAITFVSSDELEYRVSDGTTLLCKYTTQQDVLRVILTALGTQQVLYFKRIENGLIDNDGKLYLTPTGLAEAQRQEEVARQAQQEAQAAEQLRLAAIATENARVAEQHARLVELSKTPTRTIGTFRDVNRATGAPRSRETILTDVGIDMVGSGYDSELKLWFGSLGESNPEPAEFEQTAFGWKAASVVMGSSRRAVVFKDRAERDRFYAAVTKALQEWRAKYPEIARE